MSQAYAFRSQINLHGSALTLNSITEDSDSLYGGSHATFGEDQSIKGVVKTLKAKDVLTDAGTFDVGDLTVLVLPSVTVELRDKITRSSEAYTVLQIDSITDNDTTLAKRLWIKKRLEDG